ncbi:MAG TPA: hypothetical protein ENJ82_00610 [Bacteroidetes bacterium]|nr:hypothetical protein [Bacteroidota bacterium]
MKKIFLSFSLFIIIALSAQAGGGAKYQAKMGKALAKFQVAETMEDFQALANEFQLIARKEKKEWLPLYYHAHLHIIMSFRTQEGPEAKDALLDVAAESVEKMVELAPDEAEVYVMQGFLYTGRLMVDPAIRGQRYSMLSQQSNGRALAMEPTNPRAKYLKLANEMGTARHFGQELSSYCSKARELAKQWDEYKSPSAIHPHWGKDRAVKLGNSCN